MPSKLINLYSNVIDLTGDDSDIELDEASVSPFHQDLLNKFKMRSSASAENHHILHRPEPSISTAAAQRISHSDPHLRPSLNVPESPSSLTKELSNPSLNAMPLVADVARSNGSSRKRNADEAFRTDAGPASGHQRPSTQPAPVHAKFAINSRSETSESRSGFEDLFSRAETSVTSGQGTSPIASESPRLSPLAVEALAPPKRQGQLPRKPSQSPKAFSPPPLQQASIGSSLRIVPISEANALIKPPRSSPREQPTVQANSTDQLRSSYVTSNTPFGVSVMPNRQGCPFTEAEQIILIYLKEEVELNWADLDRKLGRSANCCASKYSRRARHDKQRLSYRKRVALIKAVIATMPTVTIYQVFRLLSDFIESGAIPSGYTETYSSILETLPLDTSPMLLIRQGGKILSGAALAREKPEVREKLRAGARAGEGVLNLKAMTRRVFDTPDALSNEASDLSDDAYDIGSDVGKDTLARKEYPEGSFVRRKKPYLGHKERKMLKSCLESVDWEEEDWSGVSLHVDVTEGEMVVLQQCADTVIKSKPNTPTSLEAVVRHITHAQIAEIARRAKRRPQFQNRTYKSIQAMLTDASAGNLNLVPMRFRLDPAQRSPPANQISTRLLRRELGDTRTPSRSIRQTVYDSLAPSRSWTGASGDVGTVAWSPDGNNFAAGSMCLVDPSSMQYNRSNNLLFGNTQHQTLYELPEHHKPREKPKEGANASHSMHMSQDPRLFFTVSMVDFSRDGSHMFSVGYDKFLRSYEVNNGRCNQQWAVDYDAEVDLLTTSRHLDLLATGSREIESSIRVYGSNGENQLLTTFGSSRARNHLDAKVYPSALRWGVHSSVRDYLLAGFASTAGDEHHARSHGETCLWDVARQTPIVVSPAAGNIFDVAWSPRSARFATACQAYGQMVNKGARSLVRICAPTEMAVWSNRGLQLECPARDINDVIFCPFDENYVAAGATNSKIYIWDLRRPDTLLHRFSHGNPLAELEPGVSQELADCGVGFCGWGESRDRLLTGSSDGVVKVWDIHRAPRDAHIRDLASFNSGIMSGAFNHDFSSLLIGEVNGTINLLEVGADSPALLKDLPSFHFEPAVAEINTDLSTPTKEETSGVWLGRRMRKARKIKVKHMGGFPRKQVLQGEFYDGPYDNGPDAEQLRQAAAAFQAKLVVKKDSQCTIPLCNDHVITTEEDAGDSGRAVDRIPQALRDSAATLLAGHETKEPRMVAGMLRCSQCGGLARPRVGDKKQEEFPLCERCGFSCFRCGNGVKAGLEVENITCHECGLQWRAGALGYEIVPLSLAEKWTKIWRGLEASSALKQAEIWRNFERHDSLEQKEIWNCMPEKKVLYPRAKLDTSKQIPSTAEAEEMKNDGLEDMGDLLYLVEDYYHGLWEDKPSS
jgi:WD40 repeat protein